MTDKILEWQYAATTRNEGTTSPDIGEVRTVTTAAACNQLLSEGWVLLGVYPFTSVREMAQGTADGTQKQGTRRYVHRFVGFVVGKRRES
jgi:hypothetical protein